MSILTAIAALIACSNPTYSLVLHHADGSAEIADYNLSLDDCANAATPFAMSGILATCETER